MKRKRYFGAASVAVMVSLFAFAPVSAQEEAAVKEPEKAKPNPVIDAPLGVLKFLYSGFQGFGAMFDGFVTGDKPPQGSLAGRQDPMPVTEHQRQF